MPLRIVADKGAMGTFQKNWERLGSRFDTAILTALNMARSMIEEQAKANIAGSGNFGSDWTNGLHVTLDNMRISMTHDIPYAGIFETGGTISGKPYLWLPISGSGAPRITENADKLFSVQRKAGGPPLLFSLADKSPKYFGVTSVTIPKKWRLNDIQKNVMQNFREMFDKALRG